MSIVTLIPGSATTLRSGDSTARIWPMSERGFGSHNGSTNVVVLKHVKGKTSEKSKDVTTLDWNVSCTKVISQFF